MCLCAQMFLSQKNKQKKKHPGEMLHYFQDEKMMLV